VAGCCECGEETLGSSTTELFIYLLSINYSQLLKALTVGHLKTPLCLYNTQHTHECTFDPKSTRF
jgi:hypothetical protein